MRGFILALALLSGNALAAPSTNDGTFETTVTRRVALPYRVYLPDGYSASSERWPAILFLHGAGTAAEQLAESGPAESE